MKIQFCTNNYFNGYPDVVAEFDVVEEPMEWQCKAIENYIFETTEKWDEENDGDFSEFDYWGVCFEAAKKYLKLVENKVVKTFYL